MKRERIIELLDMLNQKLQGEGIKKELVICGGAAMILSNYEREETQDVDVLKPDNDDVLKRLSKKVAEETGIVRSNWLNSDCTVFIKEHPLPKDWEKRLLSKYKASNLKVLVLAPEDILFSKLCSHIDREMDEDDIRELVKNKEEFQKAVGVVLKLEKYQNPLAVAIIEELRIRLGFDNEKE
jgi:Nucleotidyltransferase of unknown function (DUF6036)